VKRLVAILLLTSCNDGIPLRSGLAEPLRVKNAQFLDGPLPTPNGGPAITNVTTTRRTITPAEAGKRVDGRANKPVASVLLRFLDVGTGYWVVPSGAPDGQFPMELTWAAEIDFDPSVAPGFHTLRFQALDADMHAGDPNDVSMCIQSRIPDNGHSCSPEIAAPNAVFSLRWDTNVDLDLIVITPDGKRIDGKHPKYSDDIALTHDSFGACIADALHQEDVLFQKAGIGNFDVYANLFDACGKTAVSFTFSVWQAQPDGSLASTLEKKGRLIALDANGGSGSGLFLTSFSF
jgi:hypothetical protein